MKDIKLTRKNMYKACPNHCVGDFCERGLVKLKVVGFCGFCEICNEQLYTIDTRTKDMR